MRKSMTQKEIDPTKKEKGKSETPRALIALLLEYSMRMELLRV